MESKSKDPGKRLLKLAIRDAISSKLSLNSSFKRELDRKKQCRSKTKENKENLKESLVTKEMAEILKSMEKEKTVISSSFKTNSRDKPSQIYLNNRMSRSMPDSLVSGNSFKKTVPLLSNSHGSLTKELRSEQKKSVSTEYLTSTQLLEKDSLENLEIKEHANNEFYISPPYYPDNFLMPNIPNSPFVESKKNHMSSTSPEQYFSYLNTPLNSEHKRDFEFDQSYRPFSQPNIMSPESILLVSENPGKTIKEHLQSSQNTFRESKKSSGRCKQLSPKKNDKNEYVNNLIDSFVNKRSGSSSIENSIHKKQQTSKFQSVSFNIDIPNSPLKKASIHKSQNSCDMPTVFLNFKNNVCKNEKNIFERESVNLIETSNNDSNLSSCNEISVSVLCEFFKLQALLN